MRAHATDLDHIVRDYAAMVQGALFKLGVEPAALEDASQEVFVVLARRFAEYDAQRSLASWLWGIARGVASTHRRSARRRARLMSSIAAQPERERSRAPDELAALEQARRMMRSFLQSLDEDKCAVFVLSELEGRTGPEIAARLGLNLNTVYARLRAARGRFDDAVDQHRRSALAVASAWIGARLGGAKVATASLSSVMAVAVVVPAMQRQPEPAVVMGAVRLGDPSIEPVLEARKFRGPAKVRGERKAEPMPKTLTTLALAATLTAPAAVLTAPSEAVAKPPKQDATPATGEDADEAAMVSNLETREYIFDNETLDGDVNRPSGDNVTARVSVRHESLIRIRGHFLGELITLATDI